MDKIIWNDDFSVGMAKIDAQHKKIIDMINMLINQYNADNVSGTDSEVVSDALTQMTEYSFGHLEYEEKLMEEMGFSSIDEHKHLHEAFKLKVVECCSGMRGYAGNKTLNNQKLTKELLDYLFDWWTQHILNEDKKYSVYFKSH